MFRSYLRGIPRKPFCGALGAENMTDIGEFVRHVVKDFVERQRGTQERYKLNLQPDAVERFIKSAYYATLIPDENRWPNVTLMCYKKGSETDFHLLFPSSIDISSYEIAKLSHAVADDCHLCCVSDSEKLTIRGIHITLLNDRRDLGYASPRIANPLKVSIKGPGHIEVSTGGLALVYQAGKMSDESLLEDSRTMKELVRAIGPKLQYYTDGVVEALEYIFNDIVAAIVRLGHGGLLLFADEQKKSNFSSFRDVDLLLLHQLLIRYWDSIGELVAEAGNIGNLMDSSSVGKYRNSVLVAHSTERLEKCIRTIVHLAGMDGAIALDYECKIVAFNAIVAKTNDDPSTCQFVDQRNIGISYDDAVRNKGSRHQAAVSFAMRVPNSFAFVISQDGSVSAFHRNGKNIVSCEQGMRC
jgi:hypothetical protein